MMYIVQGDFLRPLHGTTPAAVIRNKNKTDPFRAVNILMRKGMGHTVVSNHPIYYVFSVVIPYTCSQFSSLVRQIVYMYQRLIHEV